MRSRRAYRVADSDLKGRISYEFDPKGTDEAKRAVGDVASASEKAGGSGAKGFDALKASIAANVGKSHDLESALASVGKTADGVGKVVIGVGAGMAVALGAAVVGVAAGALSIGQAYDEAFDNIAIKTGATGKQLDSLKGTFKNVFENVPVDAKTASDAISVFNSQLGLTGTQLEDVSTQALDLARITGTDSTQTAKMAADSFAKWKIATTDQTSALDFLLKKSQESGVGIDVLGASVNDNAAAMQAAGLSYGQGVELVAKLGKAGIDASEVMPGLTRSLTAVSKSGGNGAVELSKWVAQIKAAKTPSEASAIAVEHFGRSGLKMGAAIRSGALSLADLKGNLKDAEGTIQETVGSTDDFGQTLTMLQHRATNALEPIGTAALDMAGSMALSLLQTATPALAGLQKTLSDVTASDQFKSAVKSVTDFVTGAFSKALKDGQKWLSDLTKEFVGTKDPVEAAKKAFSDIAAVLGGDSKKNGDKFHDTLIDIKKGLEGAASNIGPMLAKLGEFAAWAAQNKDTIITVAGAFAAFSILAPIVSTISSLVSVLGVLSPALTAAAAGVGIVELSFAPLLVAVGAVIVVVGLLALAWKNNFGDIQGAVKRGVEELKLKFAEIKKWLKEIGDDFKNGNWGKLAKDLVMGIAHALEGMSDIIAKALMGIVKVAWKGVVGLFTGQSAGSGSGNAGTGDGGAPVPPVGPGRGGAGPLAAGAGLARGLAAGMGNVAAQAVQGVTDAAAAMSAAGERTFEVAGINMSESFLRGLKSIFPDLGPLIDYYLSLMDPKNAPDFSAKWQKFFDDLIAYGAQKPNEQPGSILWFLTHGFDNSGGPQGLMVTRKVDSNTHIDFKSIDKETADLNLQVLQLNERFTALGQSMRAAKTDAERMAIHKDQLDTWDKLKDKMTALNELRHKLMMDEIEKNKAAGVGAGTIGYLTDEENTRYEGAKKGIDKLAESVGNLKDQEDAYRAAQDAANKALAEAYQKQIDAIKERQAAEVDGEEKVHDRIVAMMDDREERAKQAHDYAMRRLDDLKTAEDARHKAAVDGLDAEKGAIDGMLAAKRASIEAMQYDLDVLTHDYQGTINDAEDQAKALQDRAEAVKTVVEKTIDLFANLKRVDQRDSKSRREQERTTANEVLSMSPAQLAAMREAAVGVNLTKRESRVLDLLGIGKAMKADEVEALLKKLGLLGADGKAPKPEDDPRVVAANAAAKAQQAIADGLKEELANRQRLITEAQFYLKVLEHEQQPALDGIEARRKAEDARSAAALAAIDVQKAAEDKRYDAEEAAITRMKKLEEERHKEALRQINERYALELLRAGHTSAEIEKILHDQALEAARIAGEAAKDYDKLLAEAGVAPISGGGVPGESGAVAPGAGGGAGPGIPLPPRGPGTGLLGALGAAAAGVAGALGLTDTPNMAGALGAAGAASGAAGMNWQLIIQGDVKLDDGGPNSTAFMNFLRGRLP